ncbi:MAG: hypothetical protein ABS81_00895 [Pseudonocardia sp. SCN 72-86]|nr:MAG: hypothetical protein ABS81_00895 [Pseudonocardia sp. SCN 72-86]
MRLLSCRFQTWQNPIEWLTVLRIRHDPELLGTADLCVGRIETRGGFASPSSFRIHCVRLVGTRPREYRATFAGMSDDRRAGSAHRATRCAFGPQ